MGWLARPHTKQSFVGRLNRAFAMPLHLRYTVLMPTTIDERALSPSNARFHMPGHKGKPLPYPLSLEWDTTELPATDNLYYADGIIRAAQEAAAKPLHAARAFMLTNGSSTGVIAMLLASVPRGGKVILSREGHYSAQSAVKLGGIVPAYAEEERDELGYALQHDEPWIRAIDENSDASCVLVTTPQYDGTILPLERIREKTRERGMKLLVDQAHGAHWNWLTDYGRMKPAGLCGADLWTTSAHKTLPALTAGAWLNLSAGEDAERVLSNIKMIQSSSPSYLVMASLDGCRDWMGAHGADKLAKLSAMLPKRNELPKGIIDPREGDYDPTRIVLDVTRRGLSGYEAQRKLYNMGIDIELADERRITLIATVMDEQKDFDRLSDALARL
ncbi:MAG: DegT/DnrJ/EryC1/StrS family aminotransferase [Oscillospiraceae bacterium]|nr:DegT/DnrJ/EryC1/StrS family aminotransferase [Oscillospiraceae bacterium]